MSAGDRKLISVFGAALSVVLIASGLGQAQTPTSPGSPLPYVGSRPRSKGGVVLPPLDPVSDATVHQGASGQNYGDAPTLGCGVTQGNNVYSYLAFDLSAVPSGARVLSADLELHLDDWSGVTPYSVAVYSVVGEWGETAITWNNQPGPDAPQASATLKGLAGYKSWSITDLAQDWVDGVYPNHGVALVPQESNQLELTFTSREGAKNWPRLVIEYDLPTATPTPTLTLTPFPECPDTYEPNETFETAWAISPGTHLSYVCAIDDLDYFQFPARLGDTIRLWLTDLPQNYDLALWDPTGQERFRSEEPGTADEYIEWLVDYDYLGAADFRAAVMGHDGAHDSACPYTLRLEIVRGGTPTPTITSTPPSCVDDSWEPNDSFAEAAAIAPGSVIRPVICPEGDEDYFRFHVLVGHSMDVQLSSLPENYDVCLWSPDGLLYPHPVGACSRNPGLSPESVSARADSSGEYRVQVFGQVDSCWDEDERYDLLVTLASPTPTVTGTPTQVPSPTPSPPPRVRVDLGLAIEDASPGVTVRKLKPNAGGLADRTWVDVVVEASSDSWVWPLDVVLEMPPEFGDPIHVWRRDCSWCGLEDHGSAVTRLAAGRYQARLNMYLNDTLREYRHQLVFRFGVTSGTPTGHFTPYAYTGSTTEHTAATSNRGSVYVVDWTPALIVTNRDCLFHEFYDDDAVMRMLRTLYDVASGSTWGCVYYADRYSETVRNWRPGSISYWSTANVAADVVDDLIEEWAADSLCPPPYLLIVGDDPVIPYYRVNDPTNAESDNEYDGVHYILDELTEHDGFFSDAKYADLDDDNWKHRPCDLAVGRIVGFNADDMATFMLSGQAGPDVSTGNFVGASWAGMNFDHQYDVHGPVRDYGFDINYDGHGEPWDIIDDWNAWERADLVRAMQEGFAAMAYCGHGERNSITTPEMRDGERQRIYAWDIDEISVNGAHLEVNHPIFSFVACRVGFSLSWAANRSMIYSLAREGASAVLASPGITWFQDTCGGVEYDAWSEVLGQLFWLKLLDPSYGSVGGALQGARWEYDEGVYWDDEDEKTIMEFTVFGLPWVSIPEITVPGLVQETAVSPGRPVSPAFGVPAPGPAEGEYALHAAVDASDYVVDHTTVPGFDLIQVEGMSQASDAYKPALPFTTLTLTLPSDASITGVDVLASNDVTLVDVDIPMIVPGLPMEGAPTGGFAEVPSDAGSYPDEPYAFHVAAAGGVQRVSLHVVPAAYDPVSDQVLLHRALDVTVNYRASHPFVLADVRASPLTVPADQVVAGQGMVSNVGDSAASLTPVMTLRDELGTSMGTWAGEAVVVGAGASSTVVVSSAGPLPAGAYLIQLSVEQGGIEVAQGSSHLRVVAGELILQGPGSLRPGQTGVFEATWHSAVASSSQVTATLEILDAGGQVVAAVVSESRSVSPGAVHTFLLPWTTELRHGLCLQARAWADVDGQRYGPRSQPVNLTQPVLLPIVLRRYW